LSAVGLRSLAVPPRLAQTPPLLEEPPEEVVRALRALRDGLDAEIGVQKALDRNLLIATWNLRAFGDLTEKWETGDADSPKRNLADVRAIAEIVSRFDVIAVQEARGNLKALRHLLKALGPDWGLILTDVSGGAQGNDERLAFIFDLRRVKPSGLAAELVVPPSEVKGGRIGEGALQDAKQFARTPYAVSFQAAGQTFILVTLHVVYGEKPSDRLGELESIAEWLRDWANRTAEDYNQNLICLGDFNIDREDDPNYKAFTSKGLSPPPELRELSRTISDQPGKEHYYDQIAWFTEAGRAKLTLEYTGTAGRFEWTKHLLQDLSTVEKSWRISDHYPLWAEFLVRPT